MPTNTDWLGPAFAEGAEFDACVPPGFGAGFEPLGGVALLADGVPVLAGAPPLGDEPPPPQAVSAAYARQTNNARTIMDRALLVIWIHQRRHGRTPMRSRPELSRG
jgi:hypothetical protein